MLLLIILLLFLQQHEWVCSTGHFLRLRLPDLVEHNSPSPVTELVPDEGRLAWNPFSATVPATCVDTSGSPAIQPNGNVLVATITKPAMLRNLILKHYRDPSDACLGSNKLIASKDCVREPYASGRWFRRVDIYWFSNLSMLNLVVIVSPG